MRATLAIVALVFLGGCAPLLTVAPDGLVERHYFGYVKVVIPESYSASSRVSASDTTTVGLRVQDGVAFGYFHDKEISTPLDCRLVLVVRDKAQLDEAVRFLTNNLKGESACAVVGR